MRVVMQAAAAEALEDEDDRTAVDVTLPERARRADSSAQLTEDIGSDVGEPVTKVWTPGPPKGAAAGEPLPASARRLRKPADDWEIPTRVSAAPPCAKRKDEKGARKPEGKTSEDVTRVARPLNSRAQATVIIPRRCRMALTPVRIACAAVAVLLLVAVGVSERRKAHARTAASTVAPAIAESSPDTAAPAPPAPVAPSPAMATAPPVAPVASMSEPPTPPMAGASPPIPPDELSAIEAIESGASDRASRIYAALAAAHPANEAYRETARILRESTKESSR